MKTGVVIQFHAECGVGVIFVDSVIGERYFFYANKVISGPTPRVGAKVLFNVSPRQVYPGRLPYAQNITVLEEIEDGFEQLKKLSESLKGALTLAGGGQ